MQCNIFIALIFFGDFIYKSANTLPGKVFGYFEAISQIPWEVFG